MTEIAGQAANIEGTIPPQYTPDVSYDIQAAETDRLRHITLLVGKRMLAGAGIVTALAIPAAARAVTAVEHMPPTQVPISVAGARVTAQLDPGADTIRLNVAGNAMVHPLDLSVGRKHYGVTVTFDTAYKAASLFTPSGTFDIKKAEQIFAQFSDITPQRKEIKSALEHDILRHALLSAGETVAVELGLLGVGGLYWYRRQGYSEDERKLANHDVRPLAIAAGIALTAIGITPIAEASSYYWAKNQHELVDADPTFAGTALKGWEVYGPLSGAPDFIVRKLDKNRQIQNQFYDAEVASFKQAFLARYGTTQLAAPKGIKRILFADDFQGIAGTTRVVGAAAKAYGVNAIAIGGDTEDSNLPFISVLDSLYEYAKGVPVVMGTGAHDPSNITQLAADHHFYIANGKVQEVGGIDFLPVADANSIGTLAVDKSLVHANVTESDVTQQAIDTTCADKQPVIDLAHDSRQIGTPIAETNCAAVVLQGRDYFASPTPTNYGNTVAVTSDSTGGHTFGEGINLTGIIAGEASFTIIDVDEKTLQFQDVTTVVMDPIPSPGESTASPSTDVTIGDTISRSELPPVNGIPQSVAHGVAARKSLTVQSRRQVLGLGRK